MRTVLAFLLLVTSAFAETTKLYLKDGSFHLVREWSRQGERVKFYSTERSDWEELPAELVDFTRTAGELSNKTSAAAAEEKIIADEQTALREEKLEIKKIPQDPGVYTLENKELRIFKQAESKVHTNKGRRILQIAVPAPVVLGKATVELEQEHSLSIVTDPRQEFFLQLAKEEQFGIIRLKTGKGIRIAERVLTEPISKQVAEEVDDVPVFKKEMAAGGLYKIWPEKPLPAGEYAVIEFTPGKVEPQMWDFQVR